MKQFDTVVKTLLNVEANNEPGRQNVKALTAFCNTKHLFGIIKSTYESNGVLQAAVTASIPSTKEFVANGSAKKTSRSSEPFVKHMLAQFAAHMNCGREEEVLLALASVELLSEETLLSSFCKMMDANDLLWDAIKAVINFKAAQMNQNRMYIIPFRD